MEIIVYGYLAISCLCGLISIAVLLYEDFRPKRPSDHSKMGPNYKNPLMWAFVLVVFTPLMNLVLLYFLLRPIKHARTI